MREKASATYERIKVFYDKPIIYLHITVPFINFGWTRTWAIKLSTRWKDTQDDQKKAFLNLPKHLKIKYDKCLKGIKNKVLIKSISI